MNIKSIKITERASYNYEVSEWTYEIELQEGEDPTEATNYIRNLAIENATEDVKILASKFPTNTNNNGAMAQQSRQCAPRQGYNNAPKQQYQRAPYHNNNSQYKAQPKEPSEAQVAYYTQLAQQVGNTAPCPSTSYECAQAIQMMKNDLGLN